MSFSIDKLLAQFVYDSKNPLLFNSAFFFYLFIFFLAAYSLTYRRITIRLWVVVFFSTYFIYKACGWYLVFLYTAAFIDYHVSNIIYHTTKSQNKKWWLLLSIVLNLGLLFYFKYTNFFIEIVNGFKEGSIDPMHIMLPIGISFYTFENLSYTVDVYQGKFKPVSTFVDYLFFLTFFPKLMMGPIVRAADFIPQIRKNIFLHKEDVAFGFFYILTGLFKKVVISDFLYANCVSFVFDAPGRYTGMECLLAVYAYALVIYCDFSGYSDIAIGIARWMGLTIDKNFEAPYQAYNITLFWRKWHISLSNWLRDYLYIPLGGNRKGNIRTYVNLMITMVLGGFWHGASWNFLFWGFLHGAALAIHKLYITLVGKDKETRINIFSKILFVLSTFHFVCFTWIFFKCHTFGDAIQMVEQIVFNFSANSWVAFFVHYKFVLFVVLLGLLLHYMPLTWNDKIIKIIAQTSWFWKSIVAVLIIIWIIYFKQKEPIMPVYLQF